MEHHTQLPNNPERMPAKIKKAINEDSASIKQVDKQINVD